MSNPSLTEGALLTICQGGTIDKPILQVIQSKKIAGSTSDRYRAFVSDGQYSNSFAMLATQMNHLITEGRLEPNSIVCVKNHICNNVNGKKVIILLDIEILKPGSEVGGKIGEPVQIGADGTPNGPPAAKANNTGAQKRPADSDLSNAPKRSPLAASNGQRSSILEPRSNTVGGSDLSQTAVYPIGSLTPYNNKWTIKARVTNKSDIRRWSNSRGEGHLFSMDLIDSSGEIRATAFKEQCDKYYNMIEVGKLYYISSCTMKTANKQFSNLNNEYEMTFRDSTEVMPCNEETTSIPTLQFNFVKIADLGEAPKDSIVDVIGVCKTSTDCVTIVSSRTQKELTKRDVVIVDQSMTEVNITLWGSRAETFDSTNNPIVCVKGAKLSDFNGVSLSCLTSSVVQINPDLDKAHDLKGWFDSEGANIQTNSLTQSGMRGGGEMGIGTNLKMVGEVKRENLGYGVDGKPEYYSTTGYISLIQKDKALYQACTQITDGKTCNKKVLDQGNGHYRCEKCNKELEDFNWRLILSLSMADSTDNQWITCFQEQAEQILGYSSQELGQLFTQDPDRYGKVFQEATLKPFNFRLSCKADNYNDEQRVRHTVRAVFPIDYEEQNRRKIRELENAGIAVPSGFNKSKYL